MNNTDRFGKCLWYISFHLSGCDNVSTNIKTHQITEWMNEKCVSKHFKIKLNFLPLWILRSHYSLIRKSTKSLIDNKTLSNQSRLFLCNFPNLIFDDVIKKTVFTEHDWSLCLAVTGERHQPLIKTWYNQSCLFLCDPQSRLAKYTQEQTLRELFTY